MGALQNTGFGSGPILKSRGGPGFKAAFAPGTERNLFTSAALAALGQQFLGADSPIANFALQSAQGRLTGLARKREREAQLAQQRALGLLPPEAPQFQGQFPGAIAGGGVSPGFIPGQTPIPGLEPPGQVPGTIGGGGITPEFNPRFGLASVSGVTGASLPATGPLSSFAQAQTGRRFAGAGRNFPSGGDAGVPLGLSPEIVTRTAEGVSREVGTAVRAQTARERTRALQKEGAAGRKARVEEREDEQEFRAGESALDREAKLADIRRKDEALVRKEEREDIKSLEGIAENFRKRIDSALTIDETTNPGVQAGTLQGIRTEVLGNLRLMENNPGLLPAVEAQLTRLKSPFNVKLVTMIGPDGRQVAVRSELVPSMQEQGFRLVGPTLSGAESPGALAPVPFDSEVGLTPEEIEAARRPAEAPKSPATELRKRLEQKREGSRKSRKELIKRARDLGNSLQGPPVKSGSPLQNAKRAEKFDLDLQQRLVDGEDFDFLQAEQRERDARELNAIAEQLDPFPVSLERFFPQRRKEFGEFEIRGGP